MADEVWRPITGWEGHYEVSDLGRVRSLDREVITSHGATRRYYGMILTPSVGGHGYYVVTLSDRKKWTVHTLVTAAFLGPRPDGQEVRHKNGKALDCRAGNLEYGTRRQNHEDSVRHGTHVPPPDHNTPKKRCPRGHLLQAPNLRRAMLEQGKRACRACHQALAICQQAGRRGQALAPGPIADRKYELIMGPMIGLETATRE